MSAVQFVSSPKHLSESIPLKNVSDLANRRVTLHWPEEAIEISLRVRSDSTAGFNCVPFFAWHGIYM